MVQRAPREGIECPPLCLGSVEKLSVASAGVSLIQVPVVGIPQVLMPGEFPDDTVQIRSESW